VDLVIDRAIGWVSRRVRRVYLGLLCGGGVGVLAVSIYWADASGRAATQPNRVTRTQTATCEESQPGDQPLRWTARYRSFTQQGQPARIQVVQAGGDPEDTSGAAGRPWTLRWVTSTGLVRQVVSSAARLPALRVSAETADLLSPDRRCTLVLWSDPTGAPVAVIGDSVFAGIGDRLATTGLPDAAFARNWLVTAESGFGWGASAPTWPLSTIRGSWAIGLFWGLVSHRPSCLVVELGANDSLRATFADAVGDAPLASQIRTAVAANISELLAQSGRLGIPTVLVTVPAFPTTVFGGGIRYQREAQLVNAVIWAAAAAARSDRVVVADWAAVSAGHHLAQGSTGNWFAPDGLHPDETGQEALLGLVRRAADQVTPPPAAHNRGLRAPK
jgi:lysophospholipase L1-like esterase